MELNAQKRKAMRMNTRREDKAMIGRKEVEVVEEFVDLPATETKEGVDTGDIKKRLLKEAKRSIFQLDGDLERTEYCLRPWYDQFYCMDVKHGN